MDARVRAGVLRVRARLNKRLAKAGEAAKKAEKELIAAVLVSRKAHEDAVKEKRLLPLATRTRLFDRVIKAQDTLTKRYRERIAVEDEWKDYFRPA